MGNARDTALKEYSLILDTKILSTMLYSACTSMDIIIGSDMDISSLLTGIIPILFSGWAPFSFRILYLISVQLLCMAESAAAVQTQTTSPYRRHSPQYCTHKKYGSLSPNFRPFFIVCQFLSVTKPAPILPRRAPSVKSYF